MPNLSRLLITVSGPDRPGITYTLLNIITEAGDTVADMGQSVTHGLLSLSILIEVKTIEGGDAPVIKELLFAADKMGLKFNYQEVKHEDLVVGPRGERFVLNCVGVERITAFFIRDISKTLAKYNVNIIRLDNITPNDFKSLEVTTILPDELQMASLKKDLMAISVEHQIDIAFLKDNVFRRSKRLIVFDMDSTLIQTEVIDELADANGVGEEVRKITEMAMNGAIDFDESLRRRVSKLKGLGTEKMHEILQRLPFTPGCEEFISTVRKLGYKVALISGGFSFFADALKEKLKLDYSFANELEIHGQKLTGNVTGTIVNAEQKAMLLKVIAQQEKIALEQTVAIGDGANDLPMLSVAGLGIAYHAKDIVRQKSEQHMSHGPMTSILYFLGIPGPL